MDRLIFFSAVRPLFGGRLSGNQVTGMDAILDVWERAGQKNRRYLAYMLATTKHETANTMMPIREYGKGRGRKYGRKHPQTGQVYYGRGYVQLTWYGNYAKAGRKLGVNLVNRPDLALLPGVAAQIMFAGMTEGWFRGDKRGRKTLARYLGTRPDYVAARDIINGDVKKIGPLVAEYARAFEAAIEAASRIPIPPPPDIPKPDPKSPAPTGGFFLGWGLVAAGLAIAAVVYFLNR